MAEYARKLPQAKLNEMFIADLGDALVKNNSNLLKPLLLDVALPSVVPAKVYLYNCTGPMGGRSGTEYKIQLIIENQHSGERRSLIDPEGGFTFVVGYSNPLNDPNYGIYVIWETGKHRDFAYSANLQVKLEYMLDTLGKPIVFQTKHTTKEVLVMAQRKRLMEALKARLDVDAEKMTGVWKYVSE